MNIEKEFDENFLYGDWYYKKKEDRYYTVEVEKIKSFLLKALSDQKKEIRDWIDKYHPNQCTAVKDIKNYLKD